MLSRIKDQPAVGKLIAQYDQLPRRDQQALIALVIAVFIGILYFAVWRPSAEFHDQSMNARDNAAELLAWMETNEKTIQRLSNSGGGTPSSTADKPQDGRALMALVTRSAGEAGLSLQRFEPGGEGAIRVWLENAPFAEVAAWLENLNTSHGVMIDQAAMDRASEPGRVSARFTLTI